MRVTVFGATGGTGQQICYQAVERGWEVVAFVRDPSRLDPPSERCAIVRGDVLVAETVPPAVAGSDAVVVTLGQRGGGSEDVCSAGTANIVRAMKDSEVRRLVVVTSLGVGDSRDQVPLAFRTLMATVLRSAMADKERQERIVRESGLDWVIVRPGGLRDGPRTSAYRYGTDRSLRAGMVSRADVADFVLRQLTDNAFLGKAAAVVG